MKVLIVEDEQDVVDELREHLDCSESNIDTVTTGSRSSGIQALHDDEFDFIVCDLRLPPNDGGLDIDETHGLAVYSEARTVCPGTPCLFFTGYGTSANVLEQLSGGGTQDIFGTGDSYGMTRLLTKDKLLCCAKRIETYSSELATLDTINIELTGGEGSLDKIENRSLRLLARPLGGKYIEACTLSGLSGARTLRVSVKDDRGREIASYFAKIDLWTDLEKERKSYNRHVSPLLKLGHFPALGRDIRAGIGKREALFYQLAGGYKESLFDVLKVSDSDATTVVGVLREIFAPWLALSEKKLLSVRDLRTGRIDDSALKPYSEVLGSIGSFEEVEQEMTISCQHGDLHGLNILCDASRSAVVIDFGNVGPAPTCIDPIVLELSVLFHRDSPFRNGLWPTNRQAEAWFDLEEYLRGCPFPEFIKKCREWACDTGGSTDLPPVVYAEAVRQLKYKDTDHERALGIARAALQEGT